MFPSVNLVNPTDNSTFCEGSVLNSLLILTAAQCVLNKPVGSFFVSFNSTKKKDGILVDGTMISEISYALSHPGYEDGGVEYNLALLILKEQLTPEMITLYRVILPRNRSEVARLTTLDGWGILPYAWGYKFYQRERVPTGRSILEDMFCLGRSSDGVCLGYAGSPILCAELNTSSIIQCGIHMFPFDSSSNTSYPTIYTEVLHHLRWIKRQVGCICSENLDDSALCELKPDIQKYGYLCSDNGDWKDANLPTIRKFEFKVSYISGSPDGVKVDHILGINGHYPGPTIRAISGDIVQVNVINNIQNDQNTTIHWHGLTQSATPFEDGPSLITQYPIAAGKSFLYKFPVRQTGTYWYHSHFQSQYTEGMWGALIVHPRPENRKNPWDAEFTITLSEWYHNSALLNEEFMRSIASRGAVPLPDSGLMNGHGRYNCAVGDGKPCNPAEQKRPIFHLRKGQAYLLRLINVGGMVTFNFTIDGHILKVIEVDGVEIKEPVPVTGVFLGAGQRFGIILERDLDIGDQEEYVIRAFARFSDLPSPDNTTNINKHTNAFIEMGNQITGIITYSSNRRNLLTHILAPDVVVTEVVPEFLEFNYKQDIPPSTKPPRYARDADFRPMDNMIAPAHFDKQFVLNITFLPANESVNIARAAFNSKPFNYSWGKPLLMQMIQDEPISIGSDLLNVDYGDVVQVVVNNIPQKPHPIHLHGHHFWTVAAGVEDAGIYTEGATPINLDGIRRDTVVVQSRSYVVIRFVADNPGVWMIHCHIDWHNMKGMRTAVISAPKLARKLYIIPEKILNP